MARKRKEEKDLVAWLREFAACQDGRARACRLGTTGEFYRKNARLLRRAAKVIEVQGRINRGFAKLFLLAQRGMLRADQS